MRVYVSLAASYVDGILDPAWSWSGGHMVFSSTWQGFRLAG